MDVNDIEIVLVEDNPNDAELAVDALTSKNLANRIKILKDGEEALDFFFGNENEGGSKIAVKPKLILLDLKLPKIGGLEVLQKLKSSKETKDIPVVVLTSSREHTDLITSYDYGVNSYIVKPVDFNQFMNAISEVGLYWMLLNEPPK